MTEFKILVFSNKAITSQTELFRIIPIELRYIIPFGITPKVETIGINSSNPEKPTYTTDIFNDNDKFINSHLNNYNLIIFRKTNESAFSDENDKWTYLQEEKRKTQNPILTLNLFTALKALTGNHEETKVAEKDYRENIEILLKNSAKLTKMIKKFGTILFLDFFPEYQGVNTDYLNQRFIGKLIDKLESVDFENARSNEKFNFGKKVPGQRFDFLLMDNNIREKILKLADVSKEINNLQYDTNKGYLMNQRKEFITKINKFINSP